MRINWQIVWYKNAKLVLFLDILLLSSYFRIISSGQVLPGFDGLEVTEQLQAFFYINHQQARSMLNAQQQVVHEQLDYVSARSILNQLTKIGLKVSCQPASDLTFPESIHPARHVELSELVNTKQPGPIVKNLLSNRSVSGTLDKVEPVNEVGLVKMSLSSKTIISSSAVLLSAFCAYYILSLY